MQQFQIAVIGLYNAKTYCGSFKAAVIGLNNGKTYSGSFKTIVIGQFFLKKKFKPSMQLLWTDSKGAVHVKYKEIQYFWKHFLTQYQFYTLGMLACTMHVL